jgi:hypothetical protein
VRYCVSSRNKASGFYANHQPGGGDWIHNIAYRNSANFNMLGRDLYDVNRDIDGFGHLMRNNVGFRGRRELINLEEAESDVGFMRLKAGSGLIDAGIDIGLPFHGKAPDLGAFELIRMVHE